MCDHCVDKAILQKKVVTDIGTRGIIALTANHPLWACISHFQFSKLDECHRVKSWWELLSTLILKLE